MEVGDFKWVKGKNDYEYIQLLEAECKRKDAIISRAINKLKADRKTENSSEKPNNCEVKNYCDDCLYTDTCDSKEFFYACTSKATISKMEQVEDDPQTDEHKRKLQMCVGCEHTDMCEWCSRWSKDEPQTDCAWGKHE